MGQAELGRNHRHAQTRHKGGWLEQAWVPGTPAGWRPGFCVDLALGLRVLAPRSRCATRAPQWPDEGFQTSSSAGHTWVVHPGPLQAGEAWEVLTKLSPQSRSTRRAQRRSWLLTPPVQRFRVLRQGWDELPSGLPPARQMSDLPFWGCSCSPLQGLGSCGRAEFSSESLILYCGLLLHTCPGKGHSKPNLPKERKNCPQPLSVSSLPFHTVPGVLEGKGNAEVV